MTTAAKDYGYITKPEVLENLVRVLLAEGKDVGFDVETGYSGPDYKKRATDHWHADQFVVGFSITNSPDWARYIPLRHDADSNIPPHIAWEIVKPILTKGNIIAHNAKFELLAVRKGGGYDIGSDGGTLTDTMLDAYVTSLYCHANYRTIVGLKDLVLAMFDHKMMHIHDLWPDLPANKHDYIRFNTLQLTPEVVSYACEDAAWVIPLKAKLDELAREQRPVMHGLEHKIMRIMADVEDYGLTADFEGIAEAFKQSHQFAPNMEHAVKRLLGEMAERDLSELNLNSVPQMKKLLYQELGLTTTRQTAKPKEDAEEWEKMSTDAKALTELAANVPAIEKLLEFREVKNLSNRLKKWVTDYCNAKDGRVHANYNQVQVGSGRFSANDPAIQQLPKDWYWDVFAEKEDVPDDAVNGKEFWSGNFRDFIIASPDTYLLTFDYSQVELRMLTGASQEPALLKAFREGTDVHSVTASQMLGKPLDQVDKKVDRPIGKALANYERVLTPNGWAPMSSIEAGDFVIGKSGLPTLVTGVFPQGRREIYRVTFSDNSTVDCDLDHLWLVQDKKMRKRKTKPTWEALTTRELIRRGLRVANSQTERRWYVPTADPIQFTAQAYSVAPYSLGLLLGDGSLTGTGVTISCHEDDVETLHRVERETGVEAIFRGQHDYYLRAVGGAKGRKNPLTAALRELGVFGKLAIDKSVPEQYLRGSVSQRLDLLRGLMDSDGSVHICSGAEFSSVSYQLCSDVRELVLSLGGKCSRPQATTTSWTYNGQKKRGSAYRITFALSFNPFFLTRKAAAFEARRPRKFTLDRAIKSIEPFGETDTTCISVAAEDNLFVTNDFIVTHNTFNFALLYGMGPKSLAEQLGCSFEKAKELYKQYFSAYTRIGSWMSSVTKIGLDKGYAETIFGRKCPVWELGAPSNTQSGKAIRSKGERILVNSPIQGSAADYMKFAMVRAYDMLVKKGWWGTKCTIIMNQHDSLSFEVSNELDPNEVKALLQQCVVFKPKFMANYPDIVADWELGQRWGSSTPWKDGVVAEWDGEHWVLPEAKEPEAPKIKTRPKLYGIIVELDRMPTHDTFGCFIKMLKDNPGELTVKLVSPEGEIDLPMRTSLGAEHQTDLSLALGGARVFPVEKII